MIWLEMPSVRTLHGTASAAPVPPKCVCMYAFLLTVFLLMGCASSTGQPTISFTKLPPFAPGRPDKVDAIEGVARGAKPGQHIVLYARSGIWWIQPTAINPFTSIQAGSTWKSQTHPGSAYAALLVSEGFHPRPRIEALPEKGGRVLAVATAESKSLVPGRPLRALQFAGYDWRTRDTTTMVGDYVAANAWTDSRGFLHLAIRGTPGHWTSAEIYLPRSLGYGSYRVRVQDVSHLEPAAVFAMLTWDDDTAINHQMDIQLSQWGQTGVPNGQFVIQPFFVPANAVRFQAPSGTATFELRWSPGQASFEAWSGATRAAAHKFTSGVPSPGHESVRLNFYAYPNNEHPLQHPAEVIVENFEYLP
jgi:hypothetical protein